jgi:outer membrane protein assembly factor BamB
MSRSSRHLACLIVTLSAAACVGALSLAPQRPADRGPKGLWPMPRRDAANTARADVAGDFRDAPVEVWRYGSLRRSYGYIRPVRVEGRDAYVRQSGGGLEVVRPDGTSVWRKNTMGIGVVVDIVRFPSTSAEALLATAGNSGYALVDLANGNVLWTWAPRPGAKQGGYRFLPMPEGGRLFAFPQNTLEGYCFEFTRMGPPRELWHATYRDKYWANFGPYLVLEDMDKDGKPDILLAGKPTYFGVLDIDTGAVKFDINYPIDGEAGTGRPYGLLEATDIDGDGYPEAVMVSCQVEEYVGIVRNVGGKRFEHAWSKWVEHDLPDDDYELRPNIRAFADVNGDGRREMVLCLFNTDGDKAWRTVVFDALGGWKARLAELPGRYCWGCFDLDGDGRAEIVTSTEPARRLRAPTTLQIVDGRTYKDIAAVENVTISKAEAPLSLHQGFFASRDSAIYPRMPDGRRGLLVQRPESGPGELLLRLAKGAATFEAFPASALSRAVLVSSLPDAPISGDVAIKETEAPSEVRAGAYSPLVCEASGRRELVAACTDLTTVGGAPDLRRSGAWKSFWKVRGSTPSIWQGSRGVRRVCALDWQEDVAYIYDPKPGRGVGATASDQPLARIALPDPPLRLSGMIMPYGDEALRLFIGMRTGVHTLSAGVWNADGSRVWYDAKEGPYPKAAAAFRRDGRWTLFVDNHGKHMLFDEAGAKRTVAQGWYTTYPGRGDGAKYVLPIVGPFGAKGETRLVLSPGLENLEILDTDGNRLAKSPFGSIYERAGCQAAVGLLRGRSGGWDVGSITHDGVFHCSDTVTAQDRWTVDLGAKSDSAFTVAAADLDRDGRDEFLVAMPNGELVALADRAGKGAVLWRTTFDAGLRGVIVADLDGDGKAEIIVECDDLTVRILKPRPKR